MTQSSHDLARIYSDLGQALLQPPPGDVEVEKEFVRLFLSPQGALVPPWQSIYQQNQGEQPRLMGPSHHAALAWYRRHGFEPAADNEPADHVGLLPVFYAYLLAQDTDATTLGLFEREHLLWTRQFIDRLHSHARHPFFAQLAESLDQYL